MASVATSLEKPIRMGIATWACAMALAHVVSYLVDHVRHPWNVSVIIARTGSVAMRVA